MFYYNQIKQAGSDENAVDNFWNNTLPLYFTQDKFYGIEQEQRPLEGVDNMRHDFTIRYVRNDTFKKVVLLENKRAPSESSAAMRNAAVEQLANYLRLIRAEQEGLDSILYAIVAIDTYVRFYHLLPRDHDLTDYPTRRTGDYYELKNDESEVHEILTDLVSSTSQ